MASIFKQQYTTRDSDGKVIKKKSAYWYVDYKAEDGTRKRVKGFKDKTATAQLAAKLEKEAELEQAGIIDRFKEHRQRPLAEHLRDFETSLIAKGNTEKHAKVTVSRVERIFDGCKFRSWSDISASRIQKHLSELRKNDNPISEQTSNYYLQSVKQFCKWMIQDRRASESPLEHLTKLNIKRGKQARRAVEPDEIRRLLEVTECEPSRFNATGHQRAILYLLAIETGLRASELMSLTVSSFDFDNLTVTIKAADSKNGRETEIPLRTETALTVKSFVAGKMPNCKALDMPSIYNTAKMIRADLKAAGIDPEDNGKGKIDFHSLRHTTGTLLAASGAHPKVMQSIMRHSDINLTMSRYTHTLTGQESEAIENLPDLTLPSKWKQKATGTDDFVADSTVAPAYKKLTKNAYFNGQSMSLIGIESSNQKGFSGNIQEVSKSLQVATLGKEKEPMSPTDISSNIIGPRRIRTFDQWIMSPLL